MSENLVTGLGTKISTSHNYKTIRIDFISLIISMFWWYAARLNNNDNKNAWWLKRWRASGPELSCRNTAQKVPSEINTFIQSDESDQITLRHATRREPTDATANNHRSRSAHRIRAELRMRMEMKKSGFTWEKPRASSASPPRASELLPRAAAAGQRVESVQPIRSSRPRSITLHHQHQSRADAAAGLVVTGFLSHSQLQQETINQMLLFFS